MGISLASDLVRFDGRSQNRQICESPSFYTDFSTEATAIVRSYLQQPSHLAVLGKVETERGEFSHALRRKLGSAEESLHLFYYISTFARMQAAQRSCALKAVIYRCMVRAQAASVGAARTERCSHLLAVVSVAILLI